jgi:hypothetical protein
MRFNELKAISAIGSCRTEALSGHLTARIECNYRHIACNNCKLPLTGRRFGKAKSAERRALPVVLEARLWCDVSGTGGARLDGRPRGGSAAFEYFHVVFRMPAVLSSLQTNDCRSVDRTHSALEKAGGLLPAVQSIGGNGDDHRR